MRDTADLHVGYVLKQYPRLSETFILNELLGLEERGVRTSIFSLRHATEGRFHPGIAAVQGAVHYAADADKAAFLGSLRALPTLNSDQLPDALAFVDRLPVDRQARVMLNAIDVAAKARAAGVTHLHAHFLTVAAHTAHIVHLLTGLPYSVTAHAKDIYRNTVDWDLAGRVAAEAATVITVCDANLRYLQHRLDGSDARLLRIYNGLGPQTPPEPYSRQPGLLLGVGRLVEKKGFDLLLEATARLRRAPLMAEVRCVLVGDGELRNDLENQAAGLGIGDLVTFTGSLPQDEVARWMRRADIMVAPCRIGADGNQDALPTVLLEALGAGLPAVTTAVAGTTEIITDGVEGLIVPCDDPQALAAGIASLLDDPARRLAMSKAGPVKLAASFDRRNTVTELIQALSSGVPAI